MKSPPNAKEMALWLVQQLGRDKALSICNGLEEWGSYAFFYKIERGDRIGLKMDAYWRRVAEIIKTPALLELQQVIQNVENNLPV